MRIQSTELRTLTYRALNLPLVLAAAGSQKFPSQNLPVDKEIVVQDASRNGEQEWMLVLLVLGIIVGALDQEVFIGQHYRLALTWAYFFLLVLDIFATSIQSQLGGLHRFVGAGFGFELRSSDAPAVGLLYGKGFSCHSVSVHEDTK